MHRTGLQETHKEMATGNLNGVAKSSAATRCQGDRDWSSKLHQIGAVLVNIEAFCRDPRKTML